MGVASRLTLTEDHTFPPIKTTLGGNLHGGPSRGPSRTERPPSQFTRLLKTPDVRSLRSVTPRTLEASPTSRVHTPITPYSNRQRLEDEALQTKLFWERYAKEVQGELLAETDEEKPKSHLIYSGRCGAEPKFRRDSLESIATNISLLSTSTLGKEGVKKSSRMKKKKETSKGDQPDWVRLAKERRGALDRLIARDTGDIQHISGANIIIQCAQVSELMSPEEKALLLACGYSRGLAGKVKSDSTANIMANIPKSEVKKLRRVRGKMDSNLNPPSVAAGSSHSRSSQRLSPRTVAQRVKLEPRSESALAVFNNSQPVTEKHWSECMGQGSVTEEGRRGFVRYQASMRGVPDTQESGTLTQYVRKHMTHTLTELQGMTGLGDAIDQQSDLSDEAHFVQTDYAHIPRYPQHIRVAPQLSQVIREDIRERMGRPRYHEIRTSDLELFNLDQPELGRSSRNLMIFNWLLSLDETYELCSEPGIQDLEGKPPKHRYPVVYPESLDSDDTDIETETNVTSSLTPTES